MQPIHHHPQIVLFDLRPLQTSYSQKGIGRCIREIAPRLARSLGENSKRNTQDPLKDNPIGQLNIPSAFQVFSLVFASEKNPLPEIPVLIEMPKWKRPWLWDQLVLPFLLILKKVHRLQNFVALGPLPQISFPLFHFGRGLAVVYDYHLFADTASDLEKFYRQTWRIQLQKIGISHARKVFVHAKSIEEESIQRGIPSHKIILAPLGSDHLDATLPDAWSMENFILSIGDTSNKNLAFTFSVLSLLRSRFIHLNWVIIGNRDLVLAQLDGALREDLPTWITILPQATDGLVKACYLKALALVFPSTREGFGIPILEAMRLGCPVLIPDIEPMKSILNYAPTTLPLENRETWGKTLTELLQDSEKRKAAVVAGKNQAEIFTWDATAKIFAQAYLE